MDEELDAHRLLARIEALKYPCDLDLLLFFVRHPRSLLAAEHLTAFLGYSAKEISESLDVLQGAGVLQRTPTPNPKHPARMYTFTAAGAGGDWLPGLLELAATREGRLSLRLALTVRRSGGPEAGVGDGTVPATGPVLVRSRQKRAGNNRRLEKKEGQGGTRNG